MMFGLVLFVSMLHLILGYMLAIYLGYAPIGRREVAPSSVSFSLLPDEEIGIADDLEKPTVPDMGISAIDSKELEKSVEPVSGPDESVATSPSPSELPLSSLIGSDQPFQSELEESMLVTAPTVTQEIVRWLALLADFRRDATIGANQLWTMVTGNLHELDYISKLTGHCANILQKIDVDAPVMDSVGASSQRTVQGVAARKQFKKNITELMRRLCTVDSSDAELYRRSIQRGLLDTRDAIYEFEESLSNLQLGIWQDAGGLGSMDPDLLIDTRTGLPSSLGIVQALHEFMQSDNVKEKNAVVAMFDLDYCSRLNNELGPSLSDDLIGYIVRIARQSIPKSCMLGCHSGQRFLIFIPNKMPNAATKDIENIRETIAATSFRTRGCDHQITITCAIVDTSPRDLPETLLDRLMDTLREAKRFGRNRTFLHEGTYPVPVVPPTLHVEKQLIDLS